MSYTPIYEKPYPEGYKDKPIETTPVTATIMNAYDDAIEHIENYLAEGEMGTTVVANPEIEGDEPNLTALQVGEEKFQIPIGGTSNVEWTQEVTSGTKIAEITIDDETTEVYAPKGGADAVILTKEEYDALPDTKLTDNKQYFVKDWSQSGGSGGSGEIFNTDDTDIIIGSVGGKPLYRRYVHFSKANDGVITTLPENSVLVRQSGYAIDSIGDQVTLPFVGGWDSNYRGVAVIKRSTGTNVTWWCGSQLANTPCDIWLDYFIQE